MIGAEFKKTGHVTWPRVLRGRVVCHPKANTRIYQVLTLFSVGVVDCILNELQTTSFSRVYYYAHA